MLFSLNAEQAHDLTLAVAGRVARQPLLRRMVAARYTAPKDPILRQRVFGLNFDHPVGLAAGLDKNGEAIDFWPAIGFSFVELGTVTPGKGQPGNDKPRLERILEGRGIVNRMGFNNRGAAHLAARLAARTTSVPCGANLGKAKVTPLEAGTGRLRTGAGGRLGPLRLRRDQCVEPQHSGFARSSGGGQPRAASRSGRGGQQTTGG